MATLAPLKPTGAHVSSTKASGFDSREPPSPAPTTLSFGPGDDEGKIESQRSQMIRDIGRDTPAAPGLVKSTSKGGDFGGRKRSMKGAGYYGEVFAVRETGPVVPASSGIWVELRTNVIVSTPSSLFPLFHMRLRHHIFIFLLPTSLASNPLCPFYLVSFFSFFSYALRLVHLVSDFKLTNVMYI